MWESACEVSPGMASPIFSMAFVAASNFASLVVFPSVTCMYVCMYVCMGVQWIESIQWMESWWILASSAGPPTSPRREWYSCIYIRVCMYVCMCTVCMYFLMNEIMYCMYVCMYVCMYACICCLKIWNRCAYSWNAHIHTYIQTNIGWRNSLRLAEREGGRPNPYTLALCSEASKQWTWQFNGKGW